MPQPPFFSDRAEEIAKGIASFLGEQPGFQDICLFGSILGPGFDPKPSDADLLFLFDEAGESSACARFHSQEALAYLLAATPQYLANRLNWRKKETIFSETIVTRFELDHDIVKGTNGKFLEIPHPMYSLKKREKVEARKAEWIATQVFASFRPTLELIQNQRKAFAQNKLKFIRLPALIETLKAVWRHASTLTTPTGAMSEDDQLEGFREVTRALRRHPELETWTEARTLRDKLSKADVNRGKNEFCSPLEVLALIEILFDAVRERILRDHKEQLAKAQVQAPSVPVTLPAATLPAPELLEPFLQAVCRAHSDRWSVLSASENHAAGYLCNHLGVSNSQSAELKEPPKDQLRPEPKLQIRRLCSGENPIASQVFAELLRVGRKSSRWLVTEDAGAGKSVFTLRLQAWLGERDSGGALPLGQAPLVIRWEGGREGSWPHASGNQTARTAYQAAIVQRLTEDLQSGRLQLPTGMTAAQLPDLVQQAWNAKRVVLLLDALDQVASSPTADKELATLHSLINDDLQKQLQIVVTSRPITAGDRSLISDLPFTWLTLLGFTPQQQFEYLKSTLARLPCASEAANSDWQQACAGQTQTDGRGRAAAERILSHSAVFGDLYPEVRELLAVPALLQFVRRQAVKRFPRFTNRADLYWQATAHLWSREQAVEEQLGAKRASPEQVELFRSILAAAAFEVQCTSPGAFVVRGKRPVGELKKATRLRLQAANIGGAEIADDNKWNECWREVGGMVQWTRHLIVEEFGEQVFGFKHLGMQEFFAGLYLARLYDSGRDESRVARGIWTEAWRWPLRFAAELGGATAAEARDWVEGGACGAALELAFETSLEGAEGHKGRNEYRWHLLKAAHEAGGDLETRCRARLHAGFRKLVTNGELKEAREAVRLLPPGVLKAQAASWGLPAERVGQLLANTSAENWVECPPRQLEKDSAQHKKWLAERSVAGEEETYWFWQGSGKDLGTGDEKPRHQRGVRRFWLQATAVTVDQYALFDRRYKEKYAAELGAMARAGDCPAIAVSWYDGVMYAMWVGGGCRLPTESEWEFACRAGHDNPEDLFSLGRGGSAALHSGEANFDGNHPKLSRNQGAGSVSPGRRPTYYVQETLPVRWDAVRWKEWAERGGRAKPPAYEANEWGLWQMHGNVVEWCVDVYEAKAYENRVSGAAAGKVVGEVRVEADDAAEAQLYTVGPSRVLRGGSWLGLGDFLRCAGRLRSPPGGRDHNVGLRLSWES